VLDLLVEVAAEAAQVEQRLGEHAASRRQLARSWRPVGGQHLHQCPAGGQLLAAQRLFEVPRAPPALRRQSQLLLVPTSGHRVATLGRFEYSTCSIGHAMTAGSSAREGPWVDHPTGYAFS
jgi:hypothetical protein